MNNGLIERWWAVVVFCYLGGQEDTGEIPLLGSS